MTVCCPSPCSAQDHVWSYGFVATRDRGGLPVRMLTIVDEYTRECLAIDVARRLRTSDVLDQLAGLFVYCGAPSYIRSDNGSEFTANTVGK